MHADNTLLVTSPAVQSLLKVTCVWGGGRAHRLTPFLPPTVRCPRPRHLPRDAGRATQKAGERGVGWRREGGGLTGDLIVYGSKNWLMCLVRCLDLGKDLCKHRTCVNTSG